MINLNKSTIKIQNAALIEIYQKKQQNLNANPERIMVIRKL